ncbi:MAG: stalk domain-containing protein [Bacillota bacterium]
MYRKILVTALAISLLVMAPAAGWGFGPGSGGTGSVSSQGSGSQQNSESSQDSLKVEEITQNAGETQRLDVQNMVNQTGDQAEGIMDRVQQRLQTMRQDRLMLKEDWQELKENLAQLKEQYKHQNAAEVKNQIKNMYKNAYQLAKQQNNTQESTELLKDMISIDPKDPENYKELGAIFLNMGDNEPKVFCDGGQLKPDVPPVIRENRTLVPVRAITEALGATVQWNGAEQTVNINRGDTSIQLQVRNRIALVNGREITLEVPAELNSNRVFVPLRFISEALKAEVGYYPDGQIITVNQ